MTTIVIILIIAAWTVLSLYGACALYKSWGAADAGSAMPIRTLLFWFVIWFIWPLLPFWLLYRLIKRAG